MKAILCYHNRQGANRPRWYTGGRWQLFTWARHITQAALGTASLV